MVSSVLTLMYYSFKYTILYFLSFNSRDVYFLNEIV